VLRAVGSLRRKECLASYCSFVHCLHSIAVPVRMHAQIDVVIGLISGGISLLFGGPALAHEADVAAVMRHALLGVL